MRPPTQAPNHPNPASRTTRPQPPHPNHAQLLKTAPVSHLKASDKLILVAPWPHQAPQPAPATRLATRRPTPSPTRMETF